MRVRRDDAGIQSCRYTKTTVRISTWNIMLKPQTARANTNLTDCTDKPRAQHLSLRQWLPQLWRASYSQRLCTTAPEHAGQPIPRTERAMSSLHEVVKSWGYIMNPDTVSTQRHGVGNLTQVSSETAKRVLHFPGQMGAFFKNTEEKSGISEHQESKVFDFAFNIGCAWYLGVLSGKQSRCLHPLLR